MTCVAVCLAICAAIFEFCAAMNKCVLSSSTFRVFLNLTIVQNTCFLTGRGGTLKKNTLSIRSSQMKSADLSVFSEQSRTVLNGERDLKDETLFQKKTDKNISFYKVFPTHCLMLKCTNALSKDYLSRLKAFSNTNEYSLIF